MIGIFDSGVGGLSVWRELYRVFPHEIYLYVSDSGHCPYGPKSPSEVIGRAAAISDYLVSQGAELIVVACNTATAAAIGYLRSHYSLPFVGMEPAVKPAAINSRTGAIGVLATKGTFKGELYLRTLHRFAKDTLVLEQVGEGLVELVEQGLVDSPQARELIGKYIAPMMEKKVDHIVLGCTHYPFLMQVMEDFTRGQVKIVNPAPAIARRVGEVLQERRKNIPSVPSALRQSTFVTTGDNLDLLEKMVRRIAPVHAGGYRYAKIDL